MSWLNKIAAIVRSHKLERDLDEEIQLHIELKMQENIAAGMPPKEARYAALRAFGGVEQKKEECRDADHLRWLEDIFQDLRYGLRQLRRNPGFTVVAVLTLALGIGANTAMFSVIYGILLKPLPYPQADRIVQVSRLYHGHLEDFSSVSARGFDFWLEHNQPFQYLAAQTGVGFNLTGAGRPERIHALRVSTQFFDVYGVQPFLGRSFSPREDTLGGPNVAVLSYGLWQSHFNGDRGAIGHTILLDGTPFNIIGVMPAGFETIPPVVLWSTIGQVRNTVGGGWNYDLIGRLKPAVSLQQADAYLAPLTRPFFEEFVPGMPQTREAGFRFAAEPYRYVIASDVRTPLVVLFGAIGLVLLIACVNVANLLLARTAARNREMAMRSALGAGRMRLFRQILTESVLLAAFAAVGGLLVAFWCPRFLLALAPDILPRAQNVGLNGWALVFTAAVAAIVGILSGLAPAFPASSANLNESLKEGLRAAGTGIHQRRLSAGMVSTEAALSLILLISSGLLIRSFVRLLSTNPGFNPDHLLTLQISTKGSQYRSMPALAAFYQQLVGRIETVNGVRSAAIVAAGSPLERGGNTNPGIRVGNQLKHPSVDYREITPGYFRTLGVPLLAGRAFTEADSANSTKVTIINAALARQYFHNQSPIGLYLQLATGQTEIVGVVGDVRSSLNEPAPPTFYVPISQAIFDSDQLFQGWFPTMILMRTSVNPLSLSQKVQKTVRSADPNIPISHIRSMEQILSLSIARQRFLMALMTIFAALALVLASVGLYGVISYSVTQRTHEIGIRMALGAEKREVLRMVIGQGLKLALIGVAIGIAGALALTRFLSSLLYGVTPTDPITIVAVSLILIAVALLACYIPARRAAKVDPMVALRYE